MRSERGNVLVVVVVAVGAILFLMTAAAFVFLLAGPSRQRPRVSQGVAVHGGTLQARPQPLATPRSSPSPFETGIHTDPSPLPDDLVATNGWRGQDGATRIEVWAGASADDPSQGLVIYRTWEEGSAPGGFSFRPTPAKTGAVEIVSAETLALTLEAADGSTLLFDPQTGRYGN